MKKPLVEIEDVNKSFNLKGGLVVPVLHSIDLSVDEGEMIAILGPSGSGKSTLMNIIGCLDVPTSGTYKFGGKNVSELSDDELAGIRSDDISFVFQSFHLLAGKTIWQNVGLPLVYQHHFAGDRNEYITDALKSAALEEEQWHKRPNQLSGGQRQRAAIARALVSKPKLILADEPTGNLDSQTGEKIIDALTRLNKEFGTTVIIVTHDESLVDVVNRVVKIKDGRIVKNL